MAKSSRESSCQARGVGLAQAVPPKALFVRTECGFWPAWVLVYALMQANLAVVEAAALTVGPEFSLAAMTRVPVPGDQSTPKAAFNGRDYLVVWRNHGTRSGNCDDAIVASRISQAGEVLDPDGIEVIRGDCEIEFGVGPGNFAVTSLGDEFLVATTLSFDSSFDSVATRVTRIGSNGVVLSSTSILATNGRVQAVAAADELSLVVWTGNAVIAENVSTPIFAGRLSREGLLLDSDWIDVGTNITTSCGTTYQPVAAAFGDLFLVAWLGQSSGATNLEVLGLRVSSEGVVLDPSPIRICGAPTGVSLPKVAGNSQGWLVSWLNRTNWETQPEIFAAHVSHDGVIETNGLPLGKTWSGTSGEMAVVASEQGFLVLWFDGPPGLTLPLQANISLYGMVLSNAGPWNPDNRFQVAPGEWSPSLAGFELPSITAAASGSHEWLLVWADFYQESQYDIRGMRRSWGGAGLGAGDFAISSVAAGGQTQPALTARPGEYFLVWKAGDVDTRGASEEDYTNAICATAVSRRNGLFHMRGHILSDPFRSLLHNPPDNPAVAWNGNRFRVAWGQQSRRGPPRNGWDIFSSEVSVDGVASFMGGQQSLFTHELNPAVAASGREFATIWNTDTTAPPPALAGNEWGFLRVDAGTSGVTARLWNPSGFTNAPFLVTADATREVSVAASHDGFLVVWAASRDGIETNIIGARVSRDGTLKDPDGLPICLAPGAQTLPAVASNGSEFWVVWTDGRDINAAGAQIFGARVRRDGSLPDGSGIPLHTNQLVHRSAVVAYGGCGEFFVVSEAEDQGTNRLVGSFVTGIFASIPFIESIVVRNSEPTLSCQAEPGRTYRVEYKTKLLSTDWQTLAGEVVAADCVASKTDPTLQGSSPRFYRVVAD